MPAAPAPRLAQLRPRQVVGAVRLMYVGLLLAILATLVTVLSRDAFTDSLREANSRRSPGRRMTPGELHRAADLTYQGFLTMTLFAAALWLVMAVANSRGAGWARIVATVLAMMNVLLVIGMATRGTTATTIAQAPTVLVGIAVAWLLWQPASSRFFAECARIHARGRRPSPRVADHRTGSGDR